MVNGFVGKVASLKHSLWVLSACLRVFYSTMKHKLLFEGISACCQHIVGLVRSILMVTFSFCFDTDNVRSGCSTCDP